MAFSDILFFFLRRFLPSLVAVVVAGWQLAGLREGGRFFSAILPGGGSSSFTPTHAGGCAPSGRSRLADRGRRAGSSGWWFSFLLHSRPFGAGGFALVGVDGWQGGILDPFQHLPGPTQGRHKPRAYSQGTEPGRGGVSHSARRPLFSSKRSSSEKLPSDIALIIKELTK